jgi:hypothetical protein
VQELRTALNQVYVSAGLAVPTYSDPVLDSGATIKAVHIAELRAAVLSIE